MTPEQKAAKKAEREARKLARKALIAKGGDGVMTATLEGIVDDMDARFEDTDEGLVEVRDGLKTMKADVEKVVAMSKTRKAGKNTEGMDVEKFSIGKMALAFATGKIDDSSAGIGYELETIIEASKGFKDLTKKDIVTSLTGAAGGFPLPVQVRQTIVEAGRSQSVLFSMGVINDNVEGQAAFAVPYEVQADGKTDVTTGVNMTAQGNQEGGAIGPSTRPGFKLANFQPREMNMFISITQAIAKLGGQYVSDFVTRVASKDMKTRLERACLTGRGQQFSEAMGILNRSDMTAVDLTNALGTDGRFLTPTDFGDFENSLAEVDRLTDNCQFLTRPAALKNFRHEAATQNISGATELNSLPRTPMAYMSFDKMAEFMGYKMKRSTNVPKNYTLGATTTTTAVAYGDWSNVWIPFWGPMEIEMSRQATVGGVSAFESVLVFMRLLQMYDVNIVDPVSMIVKKGFKTV